MRATVDAIGALRSAYAQQGGSAAIKVNVRAVQPTDSNSVVFVVARPIGGGMPYAVVRRPAGCFRSRLALMIWWWWLLCRSGWFRAAIAPECQRFSSGRGRRLAVAIGAADPVEQRCWQSGAEAILAPPSWPAEKYPALPQNVTWRGMN